MGQIPRETIERVLDETDIVDVVGSYFPLKRAGSRFVALCPFHNEKSPSFGVNPQRQIFHCFGCGEGGDVISFVQKYENIPFVDAVKRLADRAGITIIEQAFDAKEEAGRREKRELQTVISKASEWYHRMLLRSQLAQPARDYLKGRGFNIEVAKRWKFGYAPEDSNLLMNWGRENGYTVKQLVDCGLAQWRDENNVNRGAYARFRHRLMFPVANDFGNVIAFSGRVLSPDQKGGKYVNSPETSLFNKSRTVFGLDHSKRAVVKKNQAVVVEGQIDMISVFEAGIENTVGQLGTALTDQHARLLKRQVGESGEAVLCFDSDTAGFNATMKGFQVLASEGVLVRVASLPPGEDPDSFIAKNGAEAFQKLIEEAPEFFDFLIDRHGSTRNLDSLRDRLAFARELSQNIALVKEKMLQDTLISRVTARLGVGEEDVRRLVAEEKSAALRTERSQQRREAAQAQRGNPNQPDRRSASTPTPPGPGPASTRQGQVADSTLSNRTIRLVCQILACDSVLRRHLTQNPPPDFLRDLPGTELMTKLWLADINPESNASVASWMASLEPSEQTAVAKLRSEILPPVGTPFADDCLRSLRRQALQNRIRGVKAQLNDRRLSPDRMAALSQELLDLTKQLNDIPPLAQ